MYLEVITPEEVLFKGEVSSVKLPGKDGLFQILERSRTHHLSFGTWYGKIRVADDTKL